MMAAKDCYSENVFIRLIEAKHNIDLMVAWNKGRVEKEKLGEAWPSFNINDFVHPDFLNLPMRITKRKIYFKSVVPGWMSWPILRAGVFT